MSAPDAKPVCTDRWTLAEIGKCHYCRYYAKVFPEPFGDKNACQPCWEAICYGEDE